ncbi:MAG: AraC family transcriptional regulator [Clostridia bacterium]|nr:AraC family transcriptional regulator [Clostridia bacterium]
MHELINLEVNNISTSQDLHIYHCGTERCLPSHGFGPAVRDHYLLHFILDGEGRFEVDGETYRLKKGQAFLIVPEVVTYYEADKNNPWHYAWVGFNGIKAREHLESAGVTRDNPIFPGIENSVSEEVYEDMKGCLLDMIHIRGINQRSRELRLQALLYRLAAILQEGGAPVPSAGNRRNIQDIYVDTAIRFIATNYSRRMNIAELVKHVGIDRTYLYELFIKKYKVSPQEFLIRFRMRKACELLCQTDLPVGAVACSVGYEDQLTFSRMFRKVMGISPSKFRCESDRSNKIDAQ